MSLVVGLPNNSYKPLTNTAWVRVRLCKLQKGCTRLAAASDKVYQLLAHGRWFSPVTPASSTTFGRHDVAKILLKVALSTKNQIIVFGLSQLGLESTFYHTRSNKYKPTSIVSDITYHKRMKPVSIKHSCFKFCLPTKPFLPLTNAICFITNQ